MDVTAAVVAFFALGANLLAGALLLLFNPRNREVHWYIAFVGILCLWLLAQGMDAIDDGDTIWDLLGGIAIMMLPVLFLASAIVERLKSRWLPWLVVATGLAVLPLIVPAFYAGGAWLGFKGPRAQDLKDGKVVILLQSGPKREAEIADLVDFAFVATPERIAAPFPAWIQLWSRWRQSRGVASRLLAAIGRPGGLPAEEAAEQRRLAGAVAAEQRDDAALGHLQRHALQHEDHVVVDHLDAVHRQHCLAAHGSL